MRKENDFTITTRTKHIDSKGDAFDLALRAPANGKLPLRRVEVGCLRCIIKSSKEYVSAFNN